MAGLNTASKRFDVAEYSQGNPHDVVVGVVVVVVVVDVVVVVLVVVKFI